MATSTLGNGTLVLAGTTSGTTTVTATAVAGTTTLTLPAATDTLVGKATTDTLTNKTLTGAAMNGTLGATTPSTVAATIIGVGAATPSTSGAGITFPATQSGSSNANTLDDYEEGTWTPAIGNLSSGSVTYFVQNGTYTKIGNLVTVQFWIRNGSISSPVSSSLTITGLPFTSDSSSTRAGVAFRTNLLTGVTGVIASFMNDAATDFNLVSINNGISTALQGSNLATNFEFDATFSYRASA